nr:MAG TPA: hypothetical protein [Caudoviricetes sp.]
MANRTWVATHTGLPSFSVDAGTRVTTSGRKLWPGNQAGVFSDALAAPGGPLAEDSRIVTWILTKRWASDGQPPGVHVSVTALDD